MTKIDNIGTRVAALYEDLRNVAAVLTAHADKLPVPSHVPAKVEAVERAADALAAIPILADAVEICLKAERERKRRLKPGAPATTYTEARIARLERALDKAKALTNG